MEEKEIMKKGDCVIKYEAHSTEEKELDANLELEGTGIGIIIGIRSIIDEICRNNNIPVSLYLKWIAGLVVESTSVDIGAIKNAMEGLGHE